MQVQVELSKASHFSHERPKLVSTSMLSTSVTKGKRCFDTFFTKLVKHGVATGISCRSPLCCWFSFSLCFFPSTTVSLRSDLDRIELPPKKEKQIGNNALVSKQRLSRPQRATSSSKPLQRSPFTILIWKVAIRTVVAHKSEQRWNQSLEDCFFRSLCTFLLRKRPKWKMNNLTKWLWQKPKHEHWLCPFFPFNAVIHKVFVVHFLVRVSCFLFLFRNGSLHAFLLRLLFFSTLLTLLHQFLYHLWDSHFCSLPLLSQRLLVFFCLQNLSQDATWKGHNMKTLSKKWKQKAGLQTLGAFW